MSGVPARAIKGRAPAIMAEPQDDEKAGRSALGFPPLPPTATGMRGRCPRCGEGRLFKGVLTIPPSCTACGLDYSFIDSGDGPAVLALFLLGFVGFAGVLWFEFSLGAPLWLNLGFWIPAIVVLGLALLRPLKGLLIAQQYVQRAAEGRLESAPGDSGA